METTLDKAQQMLLTNYYHVKIVNEYFISLLRDNAHVVN
jgi:hypothetical protein